jgi:hypothetical protein
MGLSDKFANQKIVSDLDGRGNLPQDFDSNFRIFLPDFFKPLAKVVGL